MKEGREYLRDISAMRSMMERSSKFMSVSGFSGLMAGIYGLSGAFVAYKFLDFNPAEAIDSTALLKVVILAVIILILAIGTAVFLAYKKSNKIGERAWNPTTRRLLINMSVPLITGGLLCLILIAKSLIGFVAPVTLIFYGLALFNAGKFSFEELRSLGLIQISLGLLCAYFIEYGIWFWALGFGLFHIIYGFYLHYRYER
jgi:uncharacterized membrane protein